MVNVCEPKDGGDGVDAEKGKRKTSEKIGGCQKGHGDGWWK